MIPDYIFSTELLNMIISNKKYLKKLYILNNVSNNNITEEQFKMIKDNHLYFRSDGMEISSRIVLYYYSIEDLENLDKISISSYLKKEEIESFKYINPKCIINIISDDTVYDEKEYAKNIDNIFKEIKKFDNKFNIKIVVKNRELFREILNEVPSNVNLIIENDLYDYSYVEYIEEEKKLEALIEPIKNSDLSMFEKYLAVYDIVKQFKSYKSAPVNEEGKYLRYILNNDYMVCVGFSKLLTILLDKVNIPCQMISVLVDTSYNDGFSQEEKIIKYVGHSRNLVSIDDDKYGIHGIYIADPTWDNFMNDDVYFNALMTFDRKKESNSLEQLNEIDLLFDFHDENEFDKKTSFYLNNNKSNKKFYSQNHFFSFNDNMLYRNLFWVICNILEKIDYNEFRKLYDEYNYKISVLIDDKQSIDSTYKMLEEYKKYIIPRVNNDVKLDIILKASINYKKKLGKIINVMSPIYYNILLKWHKRNEKIYYPYIYDSNNETEAFLESRRERER